MNKLSVDKIPLDLKDNDNSTVVDFCETVTLTDSLKKVFFAFWDGKF